nr:histidine kinase [uncultured Mucilaginibacter sp.]
MALAYFIQFDQQSKQMRMLKEEQLHNELKYLKAQLHPHFFFNTLNNIYSLALKQSLDTAPLVAKLADMMRYILYESDSEKVPLKKEVDFISNYIDTEKIRHQSKITIQYHVQGNTDNRFIEPLILLPFIENAFKHGIQNELYEGSVAVFIRVEENEINMEVYNTKAANEKVKPSGGVGLGNIHKRLNLLYNGRHILKVIDDPASYSVNLTLQNI